jgi:hypothetical protein
VRETYAVVNIGRALAGEAPLAPKGGARFHFELPGSVQGFRADESAETRGTLQLENVVGHSQRGARSLALRCRGLTPGRVARVSTATFIPPESIDMPGYSLLAAPTLYPGQQLSAVLTADTGNTHELHCRIFVQHYNDNDRLAFVYGPATHLAGGAQSDLHWRIPDMGAHPIATVGLEIAGTPHGSGTIYLDELSWSGPPNVHFCRPEGGGSMWQRAWVNAVDQYDRWYAETYRLVQNTGIGLLMQGTREWTDYTVSAVVTPHMALSCGIAARCQGLRRYVALRLGHDAHGQPALLLSERRDDEYRELAQPFAWVAGQRYELRLRVQGDRAHSQIASEQGPTLKALSLADGGIALLCEEGHAGFEQVQVSP